MTNIQVKFNEVLSDLLTSAGMSSWDLSIETGIPYATINSWIKGRRQPSLDDRLFILKEYFNVSLEYLLYGVENDVA